ncbi:RhuM family protein [Chitinophaga sp. NPDC101104]|uniref:RhuM family protein n=1 Tax=Chitinophaga sp. NPDC101104 TaxID=3390561 RepID=UPI003D0789E1
MEQKDQVILYQTEDGKLTIDVTVEEDTVWLTQLQMTTLFDSTQQNISQHINNIYKTRELEKKSTHKKSLLVQNEGKRTIQRATDLYSLDMIISVGYRVKSKRGTDFRIWANKILKEYLLQGYALNEQRLNRRTQDFITLKSTIQMMGKLMETHRLTSEDATSLLALLKDYSYALDVLDKYDHRAMPAEHTTASLTFHPSYEEAKKVIDTLKTRYKSNVMFGNEKDESFRSSIAAINATFDGIHLYPSIEEKAAHLLYFIIKNHSFTDGNKRIAAFMFAWYMDKNNCLYKSDGSKRIAENALVALTLMIAESDPQDKDLFIQVVVSLINGCN